MRRLLPSLAAVGAVVGLACVPAEPSYLLTDQSDDANAVNDGQTFGLEEVEPVQTPVQYAPADLLGMRFTEDRVDVVDENGEVIGSELVALEARIKTTEQPTADGVPLIFRVRASIGGCPTFLQAYTGGSSHGVTNWRMLDPSCGFDDGGNPVATKTFESPAFSQSWDDEHGELVLRYEIEGAPADVVSGYLKDGVVITVDEVHDRAVLVAVTVPAFDQMYPEHFAMYTIGEGPLQP